jgi:cytochrome b subunit of formate dehydrogenase
MNTKEGSTKMDNNGTLHIERFSVFQRMTHLLVIISFLTLAISGMALKFAMEGWAQWIAYFLGGFTVLGALHRFFAIITFFYFFLTMILLYTKWRESGKSLFGFTLDPEGLVPNLNDLKEFIATIKWFFGGPRPYYGHWTYWEKFDFMAVFWGIAVIGSSGLALWFPVGFSHLFPGYWLNIATIIHSDEALLAAGFIFTIHFYNTHLRPDKFPLDPVIFVGTITVEELKHERPREYDQLVASGELEKLVQSQAPAPWLKRMSSVFGLFVVATGSVLIVSIIVTMISYIGKH